MADTDSSHALISRKDAMAQGLKHYVTGKPCKRGHVGNRLVSTLQCCECLLIRLRDWRVNNREESRARDRKWRAENVERRREQERTRYAKDPEKFVNKTKLYYKNNAESVRTRRIEYHYRSYQNEDVRIKAKIRSQQWALENPARAKVSVRNAKARRKNISGRHTADDIESIMKSQFWKCAYCRVRLGKKYHVDHITAVSKGGTNDRRNLQVLCVPCNLAKGARDPIFHAQMLGMLL